MAVATGVSAGGANAELVATGDLDALVTHVGHLCAAGDWEGLWDLRGRCRAALERGQQLWPIATLVEYRCALDGPGPWSARALEEGSGTWAPGPLAEVAASTHDFAALAPYLTPGPATHQFARERAATGEDLAGSRSDAWGHLLPPDDGVPLALQPFEPAYPRATYHPTGAEFPAPPPLPPDTFVPLERPAVPAATLDDPVATSALRELSAGWATGWDAGATARVVAVDGDVHAAVANVCPHADRLAPLTGPEALERMVWAAASGGDTGRRRGLAAGRFDAWWAVVALGGASDDWPLPAAEVGALAATLRWWTFIDATDAVGWQLCLAAEDPDEGLAWAVHARFSGDALADRPQRPGSP